MVITMNSIKEPIVRLLSTGYAPNLEMPDDCKFHIFVMSHVWATGQAKTHAIARKLVLFLPRLKVWLDVDHADANPDLERAVMEAAFFVLFYSEGYFRSMDCKREIYAAIKMEKPIILLYEGNDTDLQNLKIECRANCIEEPCSGVILEHIFKAAPICWLDGVSFSAAALNRIFIRLLHHLPFYQDEQKELLENGVKVPGEIDHGTFALPSPVNLLVCDSNVGVLAIAEEVQTLLPQRQVNISIIPHNNALISTLRTPGSLQEDDSVESWDEIGPAHFDQPDESDLSSFSERLPHDKRKHFVLLYLNKDVFLDDDNTVKDIIITALDRKIEIILVHEQETSNGACDVYEYFKQAPQKLVDPPYQLFDEFAVPLYAAEEYRRVSLHHIKTRMGGESINDQKGCHGMVKSLLKGHPAQAYAALQN